MAPHSAGICWLPSLLTEYLFLKIILPALIFFVAKSNFVKTLALDYFDVIFVAHGSPSSFFVCCEWLHEFVIDDVACSVLVMSTRSGFPTAGRGYIWPLSLGIFLTWYALHKVRCRYMLVLIQNKCSWFCVSSSIDARLPVCHILYASFCLSKPILHPVGYRFSSSLDVVCCYWKSNTRHSSILMPCPSGPDHWWNTFCYRTPRMYFSLKINGFLSSCVSPE